MISSQILHHGLPMEKRLLNSDETVLHFCKKHTIVIDEANPFLFRNRSIPPKLCGYCLGSGKCLHDSSLECTYCGGSGFVKKCECGSGVLIGSNEFRCVKCDVLSYMRFW